MIEPLKKTFEFFQQTEQNIEQSQQIDCSPKGHMEQL